MKNNLVRNTIVLFAITLVLAFALGYFYDLTKDPIAQAQEETRQNALSVCFPEASSFEEYADAKVKTEMSESFLKEQGYENIRVTELYLAKDAGGETIGYAMNVAGKGYGGVLTFSLGVSLDGTITGFSVISHAESAGLGARCKEDWFQQQFAGLTTEKPLAYSKTGADPERNEIDAISSATITSSSVVNAVNAAVAFLNDVTEGGAE